MANLIEYAGMRWLPGCVYGVPGENSLSIRVDNGNMSVRKPRHGQQSGRGMQIIFRQAEGDECIVTATAGDNLMHVALANDIAGIPGDCCGPCACGTCHVYIDPAWVERLGRVATGSPAVTMISGAPVIARPPRSEER